MHIKVTVYNIRDGVIRWQIRDFLSDGSSNVYCISHHVRDFFFNVSFTANDVVKRINNYLINC